MRSVPPVLPWAPELPPQFPPMSRNCHSPVSASHFSIQKSEIIQEQSNGYLVVFKCVKCLELEVERLQRATWRRLRSPRRASLLPAWVPSPHHHRLFCTTLHPNAPCPTRRFVGSAFPPDSPLFTRLFQIRQNVKPKNGTWRDWNSFGAQKRFKPGWFVDPLLCPAGAGCLSPPSTKTVAAATCRCSGTALRLSWGAFFFGERFFLHSFFTAGET